jgi:hypothetical protein
MAVLMLLKSTAEIKAPKVTVVVVPPRRVLSLLVEVTNPVNLDAVIVVPAVIVEA